MTDRFATKTVGITAPGSRAFDVTPSDTGDFTSDSGTFVPRALFIGSVGTVHVDLIDGGEVTFQNVQGWLTVRVRRVYAAGTTASNIIAVD